MSFEKDYINYFVVIINIVLAFLGIYKKIVVYLMPQESMLQIELSELLVYILVTVFTILPVRREITKDFMEIKKHFVDSFINISSTYGLIAILISSFINFVLSTLFSNELYNNTIDSEKSIFLTIAITLILAPIYEEVTMMCAYYNATLV